MIENLFFDLSHPVFLKWVLYFLSYSFTSQSLNWHLQNYIIFVYMILTNSYVIWLDIFVFYFIKIFSARIFYGGQWSTWPSLFWISLAKFPKIKKYQEKKGQFLNFWFTNFSIGQSIYFPLFFFRSFLLL